MKVRESIFGSNSEAKVFKQLSSHWSSRLSLYPSLPLPNILEIEVGELEPKVWEFYLKTSVDYTFCEHSGRPILSVEFDGLGGGFSRNLEYQQERETSDPNRKLKLDFKLRVAHQVGYPFIIISDDEMKPISSGESLTILDGIIGSLLSHRDIQQKLDEIVREEGSELEDILPHEANEILPDLVLQAEMAAEFENNPFVKEGWLYQEICDRIGGVGGHESRWLKDPSLERVGCRVTVHIQEVNIVRTVWIRNIEAPGILPAKIADDIAQYLAFKQASEILLNRL